MTLMYYNNKLIICKEPTETNDMFDVFSVKIFEHLTGKKINWNVREFKKVITKRVNGHIKCYDEYFIENQYYKYKYIIYKCKYINKDGIALLIPQQGNKLKALTSKTTNEWEII